jgi:hypothetical protein
VSSLQMKRRKKWTETNGWKKKSRWTETNGWKGANMVRPVLCVWV